MSSGFSDDHFSQKRIHYVMESGAAFICVCLFYSGLIDLNSVLHEAVKSQLVHMIQSINKAILLMYFPQFIKSSWLKSANPLFILSQTQEVHIYKIIHFRFEDKDIFLIFLFLSASHGYLLICTYLDEYLHLQVGRCKYLICMHISYICKNV